MYESMTYFIYHVQHLFVTLQLSNRTCQWGYSATVLYFSDAGSCELIMLELDLFDPEETSELVVYTRIGRP